MNIEQVRQSAGPASFCAGLFVRRAADSRIFAQTPVVFGRKGMGTISRQSIIILSNDQVSCDLAGERAILNLADGVYYGLDPIGARIWNLLAEPRSVHDLCGAVMAEYDVGEEECERDVMALLEELRSKGLIEVSNETRA